MRRIGRPGLLLFLLLPATYLLLLIPEAQPRPQGAGQQPFVWNRQPLWSALEQEFRQARDQAPEQVFLSVDTILSLLSGNPLPPAAPAFDELETSFFLLAARVAGDSSVSLPAFLQTYVRLRREVKRQSEHWPIEERTTRERLYRSLYGARAALEEVLLQVPPDSVPALLVGDDEPSRTPDAPVRGVTLHSGDVLVSRGGAATSALIARGNDFPGNFSHVALVHVDERTRDVSVIESHIERGVTVGPIEEYLGHTKLRIMLLRLRADLPQLVADPQLPHRAASRALDEARARHIPYDFTMDSADPTKQFCSEVAGAAYRSLGVSLWLAPSSLSAPGVTLWLSALGVRHFETQEPSDLEYDPQLRVVAEWRDPRQLFQDHADNAVVDALLEEADRGAELDYPRWQLPAARLAKAYSVVLNRFGGVGPIPEGMSASAALRVQRLGATHAARKALLLARVQAFQAEHGHVPPYWALVRLAR